MKKIDRTAIHFADDRLLNATNPITINLIGAGGTGSKVLTGLMEISQSLISLGHPGLKVRLWDDDRVTEANLGRQRFAECEVGLFKSVALINRINRWSGSYWSAETVKFAPDSLNRLPEHSAASIYISCVDTVDARFAIAEMISAIKLDRYQLDKPRYWMDYGNSRFSGQVVLSTIGEIEQPKTGKFNAVSKLPLITEEFGELLRKSAQEDNTPSCSLAEALEKQDLFINGTLAQMGNSLLWNLFRDGAIENRGFFINLRNFRSQPLKVMTNDITIKTVRAKKAANPRLAAA